MENVLVTVFIPVYNAEKYIKECIESVLAQTYQNFEILVVDDGSTDKSLDIIRTYNDERIRIYANDKNCGIPYTRNRGLELARGKYIAFLDADDVAYPKRLQKSVEFLEKHPEYRVVGGMCTHIIDEKQKKTLGELQLQPHTRRDYYALFRSPLTNSSAMIDLEFIRQNNLHYNENCFVAQDYEFFVQCLKYTSIGQIWNTLVGYRMGHANITAYSMNKKREQRNAVIKQIRQQAFENLKIKIEDEVLCEFLAEDKIFQNSDEYEKMLLLFQEILLQVTESDRSLCSKAMLRKLVIVLNKMNCSKREKLFQWKKTKKYFNEGCYGTLAGLRILLSK